MPRFMCTHTLPPGKFTQDQLKQFANAAQHDPAVKGIRSFCNLAEGKAICVRPVRRAVCGRSVTAVFGKNPSVKTWVNSSRVNSALMVPPMRSQTIRGRSSLNSEERGRSNTSAISLHKRDRKARRASAASSSQGTEARDPTQGGRPTMPSS